jgi:hypothetical protein
MRTITPVCQIVSQRKHKHIDEDVSSTNIQRN